MQNESKFTYCSTRASICGILPIKINAPEGLQIFRVGEVTTNTFLVVIKVSNSSYILTQISSYAVFFLIKISLLLLKLKMY